jgi:hypothetical protein
MQYSPKLKMAMEEIKKVLKQYDIAGMVVLHEPGHSEYFMDIEPSYSCAKHNGDHVRIRAKLADFDGNKEAHRKKVTDTSNMLNLLGEVGARTSMSIINVSEQLDRIVDAEHFDHGHSSHTEQNQ